MVREAGKFAPYGDYPSEIDAYTLRDGVDILDHQSLSSSYRAPTQKVMNDTYAKV